MSHGSNPPRVTFNVRFGPKLLPSSVYATFGIGVLSVAVFGGGETGEDQIPIGGRIFLGLVCLMWLRNAIDGFRNYRRFKALPDGIKNEAKKGLFTFSAHSYLQSDLPDLPEDSLLKRNIPNWLAVAIVVGFSAAAVVMLSSNTNQALLFRIGLPLLFGIIVFGTSRLGRGTNGGPIDGDPNRSSDRRDEGRIS